MFREGEPPAECLKFPWHNFRPPLPTFCVSVDRHSRTYSCSVPAVYQRSRARARRVETPFPYASELTEADFLCAAKGFKERTTFPALWFLDKEHFASNHSLFMFEFTSEAAREAAVERRSDMTFSLAVSIAIFALISIRQWLPEWIRIWQIMTAGALLLVFTGEIRPSEALNAVDWNIIAYLFGVFSITHALYDCGISHRLSSLICNDGNNADRTLFLFMALVALVSAVLTNDAAAAIGTPIALAIAFGLAIRPAIPLIALCVAVTAGSMMSPVGNPQNILIVTAGQFDNPVAVFLRWLAVPALLSLFFAYLWYRRCLAREVKIQTGTLTLPAPTSKRSWPSLTATALLIALVLTDSILQSRFPEIDVPLGLISVAASLPIYLFSRRRLAILKEVDWHTLLFFVAMFIVTGAVLKSGALQELLGAWQARLDEPVIVATASFWASQLFSNVPVVQIYLNLLPSADAATLMLLAGMSTLAGNLFIISAASNVIVVQQTEKLGARPFQFWEFARYVLPVTIVSLALCYGWVVLVLPLI